MSDVNIVFICISHCPHAGFFFVMLFRDIVTLVIGSTVLTVGGAISLVGGGAFLLFISPVLLFFSPILVPLAILAGEYG